MFKSAAVADGTSCADDTASAMPPLLALPLLLLVLALLEALSLLLALPLWQVLSPMLALMELRKLALSTVLGTSQLLIALDLGCQFHCWGRSKNNTTINLWRMEHVISCQMIGGNALAGFVASA